VKHVHSFFSERLPGIGRVHLIARLRAIEQAERPETIIKSRFQPQTSRQNSITGTLMQWPVSWLTSGETVSCDRTQKVDGSGTPTPPNALALGCERPNDKPEQICEIGFDNLDQP
jgi:hypothetical protein